jgi:hypothetical protein
MQDFTLTPDTHYTIDLAGITVCQLPDNTLFIGYPEAAVWLVLLEGHNKKKTLKMLSAILGYPEDKICDFVEECLQNWKRASFIE